MRYILAVLAFVFLSVPASAAVTLEVNGSGQITRASGVNVSGTLYDVEFLDGTCENLFSGCDDPTDFIFNSSDADLAAQALIDQVFLGAFDFDPDLTAGCTSAFGVCFAWIPTGVSGSLFSASVAANQYDDGDYVTSGLWYVTDDFADNQDYTFARFSLSAVPEASTWAMMLLGFGAIGLAMRRNHRERWPKREPWPLSTQSGH